MARTAPVPNFPAPPGMCPFVALKGGGGSGGGGSGKGSGDGGSGSGAGGEGGGDEGDGDQKQAPDEECTEEGHPVDVATGRVFSGREDFRLKGHLAFRWKRTYTTSASRRDIGLGFGWTHNYAFALELRRGALVLIDGGGVEQEFEQPSTGQRIRGAYGRALSRDQDGYHLETDDGLVRDFALLDGSTSKLALWRTRDAYGNAIEVRRDGERISSLVDSVGRVIRLIYNQDGRIAAVEVKNAASGGRWVALARYTYTPEGDLAEAIDPKGYAYRYRYEKHMLVGETNRNGLTYHFRYDSLAPDGRCVETWGAYDSGHDPALAPGLPKYMETDVGRVKVKGIFHRFLHYCGDQTTEVTDTRSGVRRYTANSIGLVTKIVTPSGAVNTRSYDDLGHIIEFIDGEEQVWRWIRDEERRVVRHIDAMGRRFEYKYAEHRAPVEIRAPNGGLWSLERGRFGERVAGTDPYGARTTWRYDERGMLIEAMGPSGEFLESTRDSAGNSIEVKRGSAEMQFTYDYWGRVTGVKVRGGSEARFELDDRGDVVAERGERGITRYEYDGEQNLIAVHHPNGAVTRGIYGGDGWLCEVISPRGTSSKLLYDHEGDIVEAQNARGESQTFEYDVGGRVVAVVTFDGRRIEHTYSSTGRRIMRLDADKTWTRYRYDAAGNLIEQAYSDGTVDTYVYDDLDFVTEARNEDASVFYKRDLCGRVEREVQAAGGHQVEVVSSYNLSGRRIAYSVGGRSVRYEYNETGRIAARTFDGGRRQQIERDALGRITAVVSAGGARVERSYGAEGALAALRVLRPRASGLGQSAPGEDLYELAIGRSFDYSIDGELASIHDMSLGTTTFRYDSLGHLLERATERTREVFDYDLTGNVCPAGAPSRVGPGDRLLELGDARYAWNAAGQLIEKTVVTSDGERTWRYAWHPSGTLKQVVDPDGHVCRFEYDPFGRRTRAWTDMGVDVRFTWDNNVLAAERRARALGDVVEERTYVFDEEDRFVPVAQHEGGAWYDYVTTPVGTPTELVDDAGRVGWTATLKAFGAVETEKADRVSTPVRFPGQYADAETGLHYNRFRYYDPAIGRFISPDPIDIEGGMNQFAYARNPIGWIDPLGWANGAALAAKIGEDKRPDGHQAHHIIPEELWGPPEHKALGGTKVHTAENGIYLPKYKSDIQDDNSYSAQTIHRGSHPEYTKDVKARLDKIEDDLKREKEEYKKKHEGNMPSCQVKKFRQDAVAKLQDELRKELKEGTYERPNGGSGLNNADPDKKRPKKK